MSQEPKPRFCVDCRHYFKVNLPLPPGHSYDRCAKLKRVTYYPVEGRIVRYNTCQDSRDHGGECGPEGRLFEPKGLVERLLAYL
ncbi:MAG TPA: hypothetical protein PLN55_14360 [Burkholderiaceae bacterium]|nr:hypothetical protein [Burkholderiaceae bacterium]